MGWFNRAPYTPEKHEAYLLSIETYDFRAPVGTYTYPYLPKIKRYQKNDKGEVWNGHWWYSRELWQNYVDNLKFPDAHHDYRPAWEDVQIDVDHTGQQWPSRAMVCTRCDDRRNKVSLFVDTNRINKDGWCVR